MEVPFDPIFAAFGVPGTVTVEGADPIETTVVWITPSTPDVPSGTADRGSDMRAGFTRKEPRRVLVVRRDEVPALPRGAQIEAPERAGGTVRTWVVDGNAGHEADHIRVFVNSARS